jgi:pimeloyl-ACP methyl ester carboxylesterase
VKCLPVFLLVAAALAAVPAAAATPETKPGSNIEGSVPSVADKVPIHYVSQGSGGLPVVLIHCWSCDAGFWESTIPALAQTRRVVALDLAGHGASGTGRKAWTIASYAADVKSVVEALNLRRVVLVGHSMGGAVMLEAAKMMPGRVAGLVAVDTLQDMDREFGAPEQAEFLEGFEADFKGATAGLIRGIVAPDADPAVVERLVATMSDAPPAIAVASLRSLLAFDPKPAAGRVRVPLIALNSTQHPTDVAGNRTLVPTYELIPLEGVGHFPQLERPDYFNGKLAEALSRIK